MYNNGQRMAHGVYTFPDGRTFEGGLPRADLICMSGQGTMKYPDDKRVASGMWDRTKLRMKPDKDKPSVSVDVKPTGSGTVTWPNGSTYTGEFTDGVPNGAGKLYDATTNVTQEGIFENGILKVEKDSDHQHNHKLAVDLSIMKETPPSPKKEELPPPPPPPPPPSQPMELDAAGSSSASTTNVSVQDDVLLKEPPKLLPISDIRLQRDGLKWVEYHGEDGSYYRGQVEDDKAEGYGEYRNSSGDVYKGQWHQGEKHGEGKMNYKNGSYYHGHWEDDVGHGEGTFCWSEGSWYAGGWKEDKLHGYGQFHWKDGCAYVGKYKEGKRAGVGTYYFKDGRKFCGDMSEGHLLTMKGQGTMSYPDGRFVEGAWNATRLRDQRDRSKPSVASRATPSGHGKIVWTDGSTYEGPHLDGVPHGSDGIFITAAGDIQRGDFFYGACDAEKIKPTRKRSRVISPPKPSNASNTAFDNSTSSSIAGSSNNYSTGVDGGTNTSSTMDNSNRSNKRQRSVKDLVQQAQELSQKKTVIEQLLQKRLEEERLQHEKQSLSKRQMVNSNTTTTTTMNSNENNNSATSLNIQISAEDYKKKMEEYVSQQKKSNMNNDNTTMDTNDTSASNISTTTSRLQTLREENERIKKLLEEQAKQQEQARLKEEENKLLREQLALLKRLQQSK